MEKKIKKIGIAFFGVMFFFTILSRAAASVIVAKITVTTTKRGSLNYDVTGIGIIKENTQKNIGGYELLMESDNDNMKYFSVGDSISISSINNTFITSEIENIELPDENNIVRFSALLPEGDYKIGNILEFTLNKKSQDYFKCIPIQALRQDSPESTYILIVKEKKSVLGTKHIAYRLNVTVVSKDMRTVAIDASIAPEDLIITGSNKKISEGDRVRFDEKD